MVSATVNVVRYSALLAGVFYGIVHRRTLQAEENLRKEKYAEHRREELIKQAKQAWQAKVNGKGDNVITNPDDPNFDLEKLFSKWEKEYSS